MTTERILKKIEYIETHSKLSQKVKEEIKVVMDELNKIQNFDLRDSLEEKLTWACCR